MKTFGVCAARVVVVLVFFASLGRLRAEVRIPDASAPPAALVKAALESELDGPSELRHTLLEQALARDPDFAPARWQSGFVRWDGGWLKVDEVPQRAAADKSLAAYRKMRDGMVDTADNHRALAKWCHKNRLTDEERIHWAKVLEYEPGNGEALAALGLQLYDGRWLTRQQIDEEKQRAGERLRATQHWQPQIVKWRNAIERGSQKDRGAAIEKLRTLADPGAIAPLESIFAVNGDSKHAAELNLLLIDTVGRMPHPEATQVLLRRAIIPNSVDIRTTACDQLKKRPMHAYAPQLIAALPGKLKTQFHVYVLPNGMVLHEHEVFIEGRQADFSLKFESVVDPTDVVMAMLVTPRALDTDLHAAAVIEARAQVVRGQTEPLRDRIQFALKRTTGFESTDDPQLWEKQYSDYSEVYSRPLAKPTYRQTLSQYETYTYNSQPPLEASPPQRVSLRSDIRIAPGVVAESCFAAGTLIWTDGGPVPIESVKAGDRVLTQNPQSGELAYKPVQATTLRPPAKMVTIQVGSETIRATRGHPFWVCGQGWTMAKYLSVGTIIHTLHGAALVDSVEERAPAEAYNLIVSDVGTYFVGDRGILVHDNTPIQEHAARVPGMIEIAGAR